MGRIRNARIVTVHRLKNFDEWFKLFKSNPPPKVGRWRVFREAKIAIEFTLSPMAASEVRDVKDFIQSKHMQDVFKQVNDMSTAPLELIWLEEQSLTSMDKVIFAPLALRSANGDALSFAMNCRPALPPSTGRFLGGANANDAPANHLPA